MTTSNDQVLPRSGHTFIVKTKRGRSSFGSAPSYQQALESIQETSALYDRQGETVVSYTVYDEFDMPILMFDQV